MLFSFYILAYNHENLIAAAIDGALKQTYSPLEIIISDDYSTDRTWEIITSKVKEYNGPHKIVARRNTKNMGISAHINEAWRCCTGEWIVASAGDDVSEPDRVEKIAQMVQKNRDVFLIQSFLNETNEDGKLLEINHLGIKEIDANGVFFNINNRINGMTYLPHGAAMAYNRKVFEVFGDLPEGVIFEDNIVNVRAELLGQAMVLTVPLVNHRNHTGQITRTNPLDNVSKQLQSIKKRLDSDVVTCVQNLVDLDIAQDNGSILRHKPIKLYMLDRLRYFEYKRKALLYPWPLRIFFLFKIILLRSQAAQFRRSEFLFSLLPNTISNFLKKYKTIRFAS